MDVVLSSAGRFHTFDLGRQLLRRGHLRRMYTAYPWWKVDADLRPHARAFPWLMAVYMLSERWKWYAVRDLVHWPLLDTYDRWVARQLEPCDVFVSLAGFGLHSHRRAKALGAATVCDRGSCHIAVQEELLGEEHARHGLPFKPFDRRIVAKELQEYVEADLITVPSSFAYRSYVAKGVPAEKLRKIPYGVDLSLFRPVPKEDGVFRVLYAGAMTLQKGVPYLLEALATLRLPNFELVLVGGLHDEVKPFFQRYEGGFRYLGFLPRTELYRVYSQASVFAMASVHEGLALVQAQAMACGLPVVATTNTGAEDLFTDAVEGYIVPARDPVALRQRVLYLYEHPDVREAMAQAAQRRVHALGGWDAYGALAVATYRALLSEPLARVESLTGGAGRVMHDESSA
ncbi:MAG: glycosyltransferase family 4 protein [Chloroflexi bacterium]|nr:glycosyltransferase family 4 protein [Chloroflexota bacterium]